MELYLNPTIEFADVLHEDIVRTSPIELGQGEWGMEDLFL